MGAVSKAVDVVTDVVEDVGSTINNTIQSAVNDPVGTAAMITTSIVAPELLPYVSATNAAVQGASPEQILASAAAGYAGSQVGGELAGQVPSDYAPLAGASASGATRAALTGQDITQGALSGAVNAEIGSAAKSIADQNFENWAKDQAAKAYENAPSPTEQDVLAADPSIKMDFPLTTPTDETGPGYYDEVTGKFVPSEIGGLQGPLTDASGTNLDSMNGYTYDQDTNTWTDPEGHIYDLSDLSNSRTPLDTASVLPQVYDEPPEAYDPTLTANQIKGGLNAVKNTLLNPLLRTNPLGPTGSPVDTQMGLDGTTSFLDTSPRFLSSKVTGAPAHLQELKQLYSSLTPEMASVMADRGIAPPEYPQVQDQSMLGTKFMADGGLADSLNPTTESLGLKKPYQANLLPAAPLLNAAKMTPLRLLHESLINRQRTAGGLAHGGLPEKYVEAMPKGHKPEFITGLTGYYASGKGTGQSDEIDAMLHDGDYVADADLVAALGDGSSKAGAEALEKFRRQIPHQEHALGGAAVPAKIADGEYVFPASFVTAIGQGDNKAGAKILDKMREAIRAHKRSAPTTKIPPKAKSPLDYLKMVKG